MRQKELSEWVDTYIEQEQLYRTEGRKGVENLCRLVGALGYRDPMYFGQFEGGSLGTLINFLEDNPGAITAIIEWIGDTNVRDWKENLEMCVIDDEDEEDDED